MHVIFNLIFEYWWSYMFLQNLVDVLLDLFCFYINGTLEIKM
jgi:hypothetical protein